MEKKEIDKIINLKCSKCGHEYHWPEPVSDDEFCFFCENIGTLEEII